MKKWIMFLFVTLSVITAFVVINKEKLLPQWSLGSSISEFNAIVFLLAIIIYNFVVREWIFIEKAEKTFDAISKINLGIISTIREVEQQESIVDFLYKGDGILLVGFTLNAQLNEQQSRFIEAAKKKRVFIRLALLHPEVMFREKERLSAIVSKSSVQLFAELLHSYQMIAHIIETSGKGAKIETRLLRRIPVINPMIRYGGPGTMIRVGIYLNGTEYKERPCLILKEGDPTFSHFLQDAEKMWEGSKNDKVTCEELRKLAATWQPKVGDNSLPPT